jgi:hypothetical protein
LVFFFFLCSPCFTLVFVALRISSNGVLFLCGLRGRVARGVRARAADAGEIRKKFFERTSTVLWVVLPPRSGHWKLEIISSPYVFTNMYVFWNTYGCRCPDEIFLTMSYQVTISNHDSLSSSESGANVEIRSCNKQMVLKTSLPSQFWTSWCHVIMANRSQFWLRQ